MEPSDHPEIYEFLTQVLRDAFGRDDITAHAALTAAEVVGWDSFKQVEIILALEDKFSIRIQPRDARNLRNVGDLVQLVQQKRAAA